MAVVRYGNDWEGRGADGYDTVFLVQAKSIQYAAEVVDTYLQSCPLGNIEQHCHEVHILDHESISPRKAVIIGGPLYGTAWIYGEGRSFYRSYHDDDLWELWDSKTG